MIDAIATQAAPPPRLIDLVPAMPQQPDQGAIADFNASLSAAVEQDIPPAVRAMLGTLDQVNGEARSVANFARSVESSGGELTPGEIVQLTMRCQEFMFHCQLTSNIANRSSDGVQQLFRQQS